MDDTTLDWENFLLALMLSYNTNYHSTISTTPFKLLFSTKLQLLCFPYPDIQRMHYEGSTSAKRYQLLKKFGSWLKTSLQPIKKTQKLILIKELCHIHLPLMTYCGTRTLHSWVKIPSLLLNGRALLKLQRSMILMRASSCLMANQKCSIF